MAFESQTSRSRKTGSSRSKLELIGGYNPFRSTAMAVPAGPMAPPSTAGRSASLPRFGIDLLWRRWACRNPICKFRRPLRRFFHLAHNEGLFLQDRWYCSLDCFEQAISLIFAEMMKLPDEPLLRPHRVPLGLLLLGRGVITQQQLRFALETQRQSANERIGRSLIRLGIASAQDVSAALASQWGCAVFPLERDQRYRQCSHMIPLALLEAARMIPVHYIEGSRSLFLAFSEDVDHTTLYSIERLLDSRTEPCVVSDAAMEQALHEIRAGSRPTEIVFETVWDSREMAHTIRDYALKFGAEELLLARPRRFLWVRLKASGNTFDLLFRLPQGNLH